jgi:hypothetical protein
VENRSDFTLKRDGLKYERERVKSLFDLCLIIKLSMNSRALLTLVKYNQ